LLIHPPASEKPLWKVTGGLGRQRQNCGSTAHHHSPFVFRFPAIQREDKFANEIKGFTKITEKTESWFSLANES